MKTKLLMVGLLTLISAATFAQKGELNNAKEEYENYAPLNSTKSGPLFTKATTSLNNAKTSIDKAAVHEKTASLPLTSALKAVIYASLALRDTVPTTSAPLFATADEAYKKAKELDTKGDNKKYIDDAGVFLAQYKLTEGVNNYQNKLWDKAYTAFDYYRSIRPDDTTAIFYTGLAAQNAGNKDPKYYQFAITNYNKLVTTKYSKGADIYLNLSSIYLLSKDTANALKSASDGVSKYPTNAELRKREIEIGLQSGKQKDIIDKISTAIANDPKNKTLYYYSGLTYSQLAEDAEKKSLVSKDDATKKTLHQSATDNFAKAADSYKKAIDIDPDYFEANLNMGYILMRPAIELFNQARLMPANKQKEYEAVRIKADALFDLAKPYLQKAADINPKSSDALTNLRNYYKGKFDPTHSKENNDKAAEIKKKIDAL
jgi:Tfp pilus assembly protein PilF